MLFHQGISYFNPRSPHGERLNANCLAYMVVVFQSTLPARGATVKLWLILSRLIISIHAPRTGSDVFVPLTTFHMAHFNPRSPHGERPVFRTRIEAAIDFNPRSPHGERRSGHGRRAHGAHISIHAPRTGSDLRNSPISRRKGISIHAPRTGSDH